VVKAIIWMCYPWILSAVINLGEVIILTISEFIGFFRTFACIVVIKLLTFTILSILIVYSIWVVFVFIKEVQEEKKYRPLGLLSESQDKAGQLNMRNSEITPLK